MSHLTIHKHRGPNYLRAYKAPAYKAAAIYVLIKHLYICRESFTNRLFYAKQTQFPKGSNEHKCCYNKGIQKKDDFAVQKNKPNSNPIKPNTNPIKANKIPKSTLSSFCKDWLNARKPDLRPASYELYQYAIKRLETYFGKEVCVQDVTPKDAVVFVSKQKSLARGHEGKILSDWSREQIKRYCKLIFDAAVKWSLIRTNPFDALRFKKPTTKRWHRVTAAEYHAMLEAAPTLRWKVFYALAYTSGARVGELFSLTWSDIDFENSRLVIANRDGTIDMPPFYVKDHEARRIPLPKHTIDLLTEWQAKAPEGVPYILLTKERYERVKAKWQRLRKQRQPWKNRYMVNNVLRDFKRHFRWAGIKPVAKLTVHTLRKSCGQNWADHLPMNVVKELMGHSKAETTLEYYSQVDKDHEQKAARVIQKLLESVDESKKTDARLTPGAVFHQNGGVK
jgi:integrase